MEIELRSLILGIVDLPPARVNWGSHPQGEQLPSMVMRLISDVEGYHMKGADGLSAARVQIDCYATTYGSAKQLANAVRDSLSGHRGGRFQGIFLVAARDTRETEASDRPFNCSQDFIINYER